MSKKIYISIGNACNAKMAIQKHRGHSETLFFDWLMTDMRSVLDILKCENIEDILQPKNIVQDAKIPVHQKNARIRIEPLPYCISIHDLAIEYTETDVLQMIEKYTKRHCRIIEWIASNNTLVFLRVGKMYPAERAEFIETILAKNPHCHFFVVSLVFGDVESIHQDGRFIEFCRILSDDKKYLWNGIIEFVDWESIFEYVESMVLQ
jgi:Putative papain-like cysteine peptidase (DUF1796)